MTTTTASTHPAAIRNRVAKARRIVAAIDSMPDIFADVTADVLAELSPTGWALLNTVAGETRPLSDLTIATVIGMVAAR